MSEIKPIRNYPFRGKIYTAKQIDEIISSVEPDLSNYYDKSEIDDIIDNVDSAIDTKQDTLTAGDNISIVDNVISVTSSGYVAGDGISIENDVISLKDYSILPNYASLVNDGYLAPTQPYGSWYEVKKDFSVMLITVSGYNNRFMRVINFYKGYKEDNANGIGLCVPAVKDITNGLPLFDYLRLSNLRSNTYLDVNSYYYPCSDVSITVDGTTYNVSKVNTTRTGTTVRYNYTTNINQNGDGTYCMFLVKN